MIKALRKIWKFLDGKKTAIGTVCLLSSRFFKPGSAASLILEAAGALLGGVGIAHKAKKRVTVKRRQPNG